MSARGCHIARAPGSTRPMTAPPMAVAALCVLLGACAPVGRGARLDERMRDYVYQRPLAEVLAEARAMLGEQRFRFREEEANGIHVVATEWLGEDEASAQAARWTRLLVIGKSLGDGRSVVHIYSASRVARADDQWKSFTSWKSDHKFAAEAQDDSGVPREFVRAEERQKGALQRSVAWTRSAARDLQRERALFERVTARSASSGAPLGGSPPGSSPG